MSGSPVVTKKSLIDLAKVYSPKYERDESYLIPKSAPAIVDLICQRIAAEPDLLSSNKNLIAFKSYLKDCLKKECYPAGAVRLVASLIKHSSALKDVEKNTEAGSCKNVLIGIGSIFYKSVHTELKSLRRDFETYIRPTDGMRLQVNPVAQARYADLMSLQAEMHGLNDHKYTGSLYMLGLGQYEIRSLQRLIDENITYFGDTICRREKQIARDCRSYNDSANLSRLVKFANLIFPQSWIC